MEEKMYTTKEVMKLLAISRWTIIRWRKENRIKCVMIGTHPRYPQSEIERIVKEGVVYE